MPQSSGAGIIIRFDEFEVDLTAGQLARNGKRVKVQNLPYRLLVILLERPGEIVAYDELQTGLWGEAAVDVEEGLHTAVRKLRAVLGDSATNPRFIETVPRRGYCFVAPVVKDAIAKTVASSRETEGISGRAWTYISIAGAVLLILASSAALIYRSRGSRGASPEARPITAYRGVQRSPALSPDGTQIVFSWVGEPGDNLDIYKQRIDGSDRVRLTSDPAADQQPAWSRDGKTIAFVRNEALFAVPAIGGRERRITSSAGSGVSWSPDSQTIAFSDRVSADGSLAIFLIAVDSGQRRQLTSPPSSGQDDLWPTFSPDGRAVAFIRRSTPATDVYRVPIAGGNPTRVALAGRPSGGLVWSPDGRYLLFATGRHAPGILVISADAVDAQDFRRLDVAGFNAHEPSIIARSGGQEVDLAYGQETTDWDIVGMAIGTPEGGDPKPLAASIRADQAPSFSPDGQRLAFCSSRTGYEEIWASMADGSQPKRLTNFNAGVANGPRWSPDGRWIAFGATIDKNPDIYVVSADGGPPQPMTRESSAETQPSWSRDGRWIYFMSNRSGEKQIWKIPTRGGEASQVTRNGGFQALESADGYLYYAKRQSGRGLWRVPVNGGAETPVSDVVWHNLWAISDESIYYLDVTNEVPQVFAISRPIAVRRIDLKTQKVTTITTIDASFPTGAPVVEVSRDGKQMAWVRWREHHSEIMLIRNLRLD